MKNLMLMLMLLWIAGISGAAVAADLKVSKYPKVYKGEEGITVTVAEVMPKDRNQALIQVRGIDDDIDEKVFLYDTQVQGKAQAYVWVQDGQERTRMRAEDGYWFKQYTVYLPGKQQGVSVWYDEKLSQKVNVDSLLKKYKTDSVLQQKLAKFNRKANERRNEDELKKLDAEAGKSCGGKVATKINWASIKDEQLKTYAIYAFCGRVAENLDYLCRNKAEVKASAAKITNVDCKFGSKLKLTRAGSRINIEVEPETGNQDDFVRNYLQNEL